MSIVESIAVIYKLIACHMLGDYVLQTDFLAKTKGDNLWHLLAHCVTYSVPFAIAFGIDWRISWIIITHFQIDMLKARWNAIGYAYDQIAHIAILLILYAGLAGGTC